MQLPYEIWKVIVSYIPVGQAKELYTVNRALFNIAMDLRYPEARLWSGSPKAQVHKDLRVFRYPLLSCRPKTLQINLSSIAKSLSKMNKRGYYTCLGQRIMPSIIRKKFDTFGAVSEIIAVGLDALPRLSAVMNLSVIHDHDGTSWNDPLIVQLIKEIWQIFGDRLQSLQVQASFRNLEFLLPTSMHLPNLQRLIIDTQDFYSSRARTCESIIRTMIQSHASTLRLVSFTTNNAAIDPQSILRSLQDLSCLQAIHLSFPFGTYFPSPFPAYHTLYNCRHHLKFLSLNFESLMHEPSLRSLSLFREDWCRVDLPYVRELRIVPPVKDLGQDFIDYIHRFAPTLISLWIKPNLQFRFQEVKHLSSIFHDFLSLRDLSISIYWICPEILALFAQTLPCLQTLNLRYSSISSTTDEWGRGRPDLFYQRMQPHIRLFREWQLMSLDRCCVYNDVKESPYIAQALLDHLPNVEWYCGVDRLTYVSDVQLLWKKYQPPTTSSWY